MDITNEKMAIFWCDLLRPIIFDQIEPEAVNKYLKEIAQNEVVFPDGQKKKPSLSTLRRKLSKFRQGGFKYLFRQSRSDKGKSRSVSSEIMDKAVSLKKEQPYRSDRTINRILQVQDSIIIPRSTLYRHLKEEGATRIKLGVSKMKVRKRIVKDHTHDLWVGDFEEGPYVMENNDVRPTYLCAFIDHYSRYIVDARYYLRQNLDILIDSWIRALALHGSPRILYVDNAKVYHSHGLKQACYTTNTRLKHRPKDEPETGGLIERFFQTVQSQFESEVRSNKRLPLEELNRKFKAYVSMAYHKDIHTDINKQPEHAYQEGLQQIREVEINEVISAFMQKLPRTVNRTYSDIQLNKKYFRVDKKYRGDRVEVRYDIFSHVEIIEIYSLKGAYLGKGYLHNREEGEEADFQTSSSIPKHDYLELLVREHEKELDSQAKGIDYRKVVSDRLWPFHSFVNSFASLLGRKGGISAFTSEELETLKKTYNQSLSINKEMLLEAFELSDSKTLPYIIYELKQLIKRKGK